MNRIVFAVAALTALGASSTVSADTLTLDNVSVGAPGEENSVSIHYFSVSEDGLVNIEANSPWVGDEDHISTQMYLFDEDGGVIAVDTGILSGNAEISEQLAAGNYVLAIGDFPLSAEEAWAGVNDPDHWENYGIGRFDGKYDLVISSEDSELTWSDGEVHEVPELSADSAGAALLLLVGGVALLSNRRRRRVV